MKWFRFYSEALHDPKVQNLRPEMRWYWVAMLCMASEGTPRGKLPDREGTAYGLRMKPSRTDHVMQTLTSRGLLEQRTDGLYVHNWDGRQRDSDTSAERVKRHRVTLQKRDGNALEVDRDIEVDKEEIREEAAAHELFEKVIGPLNSHTVALVDEALGEAGELCVLHCLEETAVNGAKSWRYTEAILRRHKEEGCESKVNGRAPVVAKSTAIDTVRLGGMKTEYDSGIREFGPLSKKIASG